ncbi:MAG: prolyl oligopeptidase family serine peptidase, partial [Elusimicrobia bacterium]|nr:prolyl oligopeptidase family serine peptidase [Elusimicrobiota bacterium]
MSISFLALAALLSMPASAQKTNRFSAPREWIHGWATSKPEAVLAASDASGLRQLYLADVKRGRWTQVTEEPAGVPWGTISPDGQWALFLRDEGGSEIGQLFKDPVAGGKAEVLIPEFSAKSIEDAEWGASGKTVYFVGSDRSGFGIYQYALGTGRAFTLYFSTAEIVDVLPSDDERYLAFVDRSQPGGRTLLRIIDLRTGGGAEGISVPLGLFSSVLPWAREGDLGRMLVASDEPGQRIPGIWTLSPSKVDWLDSGLSGDVTPLDWFPGGKDILLLQTDGPQTALWRFDGSTSPVRLDGGEGRITWARVRPNGSVWAAIQSGEHPPQVMELAQGKPAKPALPAQGSRRQEGGRKATLVTFQPPSGHALSGWLVSPSTGAAGRGGRAAVIWLPDSPGTFLGDDWDPLRLGLADEGIVTFAFNPRGSSSFGRDFQTMTWGDPGRLELEDIAQARDWLIKNEGVDPSSVAVAGRFYGGYLALSALTKQPDLWAAGMS